MLIIYRKFGRLGNRLILYAHIIANAHSNNYTVFNPSFDEYMDYFTFTSGNICSKYPSEIKKIA